MMMCVALAAALSPAAGCDESEAPILTASHAGWRAPGCAACHLLPESDHTQTEPSSCAACHGGNGACAPNGARSKKKDHDVAKSGCVTCHGAKHNLTGCASCHFASAGVISCGAGVAADAGPPSPDLGAAPDGVTGPTLSTKLQHNCLGWPKTPFSQSNRTGWFTAVKAGQRAVAFSLKDTAGKAYALADLLKKGPVWLQLGSYT